MKAINRMCVGCRTRESTELLVRIVNVDGQATVDLPRTAPGRGAYLHRNQECIRKAVAGNRLARALRVRGDFDSNPLRDL